MEKVINQKSRKIFIRLGTGWTFGKININITSNYTGGWLRCNCTQTFLQFFSKLINTMARMTIPPMINVSCFLQIKPDIFNSYCICIIYRIADIFGTTNCITNIYTNSTYSWSGLLSAIDRGTISDISTDSVWWFLCYC